MMASPPSTVSTTVTTSPSSTGGSELGPDPQLAAERKRKRKESNRLSAQRSRARKQRQLDDLTAQVAALRARNGAMDAAARDAARRCVAVQAENAMLHARTVELSARLQSLVDLIQCMQAGDAMYQYQYQQQQLPLVDATIYNYY